MSIPNIILIAGPSSSGKSTLATGLAEHLTGLGRSSVLLALDNYYRDLRHLTKAKRDQQDFDQPDAWEQERLIEEARLLKQGKTIEMPIYDFNTHLRSNERQHVEPQEYIILEGLFALCYDELNALADLKIFVDLEDEIALKRRIIRDTKERGRTEASVIEQYRTTVQPANLKYIRPSAHNADLALNGTLALATQLELIQTILPN